MERAFKGLPGHETGWLEAEPLCPCSRMAFHPPCFLLLSSSCLDVANIFRMVPSITDLENNILLSSFACVKHLSSFPPAHAWFYRKDMLRVEEIFVLYFGF